MSNPYAIKHIASLQWHAKEKAWQATTDCFDANGDIFKYMMTPEWATDSCPYFTQACKVLRANKSHAAQPLLYTLWEIDNKLLQEGKRDPVIFAPICWADGNLKLLDSYRIIEFESAKRNADNVTFKHEHVKQRGYLSFDYSIVVVKSDWKSNHPEGYKLCQQAERLGVTDTQLPGVLSGLLETTVTEQMATPEGADQVWACVKLCVQLGFDKQACHDFILRTAQERRLDLPNAPLPTLF